MPEDDKTTLNEWFAAVPDTLWEALESLDTALGRLEKLHGPPTPNGLVTAMNNAESSLMTALDAARTAQRKTLGSEAAAQRAGRIRAAELDTSGLRARAFARSSALF